MIEDAELAFLFIESQLQFAQIEDAAVLISQDWNQNFSLEFILQRLPVDIEEVGITGGLSIFQDVQPPAVVTPHHSHVIGYDVQDLSHGVSAKFTNEELEVFLTAYLRI